MATCILVPVGMFERLVLCLFGSLLFFQPSGSDNVLGPPQDDRVVPDTG